MKNDSNRASPKAYGDFVFIEDSPGLQPVPIVVTGEPRTCQRQTGSRLPTLYMLLCAHAPASLNCKDERVPQPYRLAVPARGKNSRPQRRPVLAAGWARRTAGCPKALAAVRFRIVSSFRLNASEMPSVQKSTESPASNRRVSV